MSGITVQRPAWSFNTSFLSTSCKSHRCGPSGDNNTRSKKKNVLKNHPIFIENRSKCVCPTTRLTASTLKDQNPLVTNVQNLTFVLKDSNSVVVRSNL